jgi:hypothetical protein
VNSVQYVDLAQATRELDLEWRLRNIPATARLRGAFFQVLNNELSVRGLARLPELDRFRLAERKSYSLYPVRELVEAFAIGGAIAHKDVREGMRQLFTSNVRYQTHYWYGRVFLRYLRPYDALRWLERSRDYIGDYGHWRLEYRSEGHAIMHKRGEYFWFDALKGAAEGLLDVCGVHGEVQVEEDAPFNGRFIFRWG